MNQTHSPRRIFVGITLVAAVAALLLASCESVPSHVPEGLTQAELFQRAQEAADNNNWQTSLLYYQTFIDRYPSDRSNIAAARYEIAFIHYKQGKYALAKTEFEALLNDYKGPNADQLPQWPKVLADKILAKVDEHIKGASAGKSGSS